MTCARREAGARTPAPSTPAGAPRRADARTGRVGARLFGLLPALALLLGALSPFAAAPAAAAVLVSNIGQAASGTGGSFYSTHAQGFTTGGHAAGYELDSIEVHLTISGTLTAQQIAALKVELWSNSSGVPGSKIASLSGPSSITTGAVTFTAPNSTTLSASTNYFVVMYSTVGHGSRPTTTTSNDEDSGAASGWSIADNGHSISNERSPSGTFTAHAQHSYRVRVNGAAAGTTPPASAAIWSATLTVKDLGSNNLGCSNFVTGKECSSTSILTESNFVLSGNTYAVTTVIDYSSGTLEVAFDRTVVSDTIIQALKFCVGTTAFAMTSGKVAGSSTFHFPNTNLSWSAGDTISLSIGSSCAGTTPPVQSTDATLSALTATSSDSAAGTFGALTLTPTFAAATTGYTASVANSITHVKLTPTVNHASATVEVGQQGQTLTAVSSATASAAIALAEGANPITVKVTAEDGTTTETYTVTVTRAAAAALSLSGLTLSAGGVAVTLTPAFSGTVTSYTASVASGVTTLSLTPTWTGDHTVSAGSSDPAQDNVFTSLSQNQSTTSGASLNVTLASSGDTRVTVFFEEGNPAPADGVKLEYLITVSKQTAPPPGTPTVSLSVSPNPVTEGGQVTVRATLSSAATAATSIPIEVATGTSESGDHGDLTSITIASGATYGEGTIATNQDAGTDDETFTVALGTLPAGLAAGTQTSVTVTITDDDATPQPPSSGGAPTDVKVGPAGAPGTFRVSWRGNANRDPKWNAFEVEWRLESHGAWMSAADRARGYPVAKENGVPVGGFRHTTGSNGVNQSVSISVAPFDGGPLADEALVEARVRNARGTTSNSSLTIHEWDSEWSATAEGKAGGDGLHKPNRPQNVTVTPGFRSVTVTWDPPTWDGGSPITKYVVWHEAIGGANKGTLPEFGADARTATITGLTTGAGAAGVDYFVSVAAKNAKGQGPGGQDHAIPWDKPDAPYNVTVKAGEVHWTAPSGRGSGVYRYEVQYKNGGAWEGNTAVQSVTVAADSGRYDYSERKVAIAGVTASGWQARVCARNAAPECSAWGTSVQGGMQGGAGQAQPEGLGRLRLPALHASFFKVPGEHGGPSGKAAFRVRFSIPVPATPAALGAALEVTGGTVKSVRRLQGRSDLFEVRLAPSGFEAMTVRLPVRACGTEGAICTGYGQALSQAVAATIEGPSEPMLSVADARAKEGPGAKLKFAVTLDRAGAAPVTVDWATADGTATAGEDYTAASGTLTFAPGVTKRTVRVALLDDAHDEGKETMKLRLSNPRGARIADARATGTIRNSDPLQATWLGRFGRAVAADAVATVTARFETPRDAGSHFTLAGQRLDLARAGDGAALAEAVTGLARALGAEEAPAAGGDPWNDPTSAPGRSISTRELLMGTSFRAVLGQGAGAQWTSWGQGASVSQFSSATPGLSLSGEAATGSLGMDYERGSLLAGFAMMHTLGEGTAHGAGRSYAMGSTVTTVLPYAWYALTERISAWGLAGTGSGALTLELDDVAHRHRAGLSMTLAAAGVRGELLTPAEAGGFALALKADAFWVRTESDAVSAPGVGNLAAARADATRLRAVLDGSRTFSLTGGATLAPSVELGLRHDGGDASTGDGASSSGPVSGYADPLRGLDMALRVHGLAASAEDGYREWGVSGSLEYVPGAAGRGLSMSLTPSYGAEPGGSERLWTLPDASRLAANDDAPLATRLDAELGYGLPVFGGGFTGTPNLGFGLSDTARDWRLGWRLTSALKGDPGFELSLDATRREGDDDGADHGVMLRSQIHW